MPTKKRNQPGPWPEGGELFADIAGRNDPALTKGQLHKLARLFLDEPGPKPGWAPGAGQSARSVLVEETTVMALMVQAWAGRAAWALPQCPDHLAQRNFGAAVRVLRAAIRYLPDGEVQP
ncbi:MAG: hypothetical protein Q8K96_02310 [Rubrivivax sp.]|nr:hypothetical protein [Rubrivivax sp.]